MTITFTEKLKAAGAEAPTVSIALARPDESAADEISLRYMARGGGFVHSVRCRPGCITVIQESGDAPLRDALLGNGSPGQIDLRSGSNELHRSEIFHALDTSRLSKESSVRQALQAVGAPTDEIPELLRRLGLELSAETAPRDLNPALLKRLAVGCSLFARARILLFDRPFSGAEPAWIERIARLLLEIGEANARVLLITGEAQIPQVLRNDARVLVQDPRRAQKPSDEPAVEVRAQSAARNLIQASAPRQSKREPLVTRPQSIYYHVRPVATEGVHSEAIANPHSELAARGGRRREVQDEESPLNEYRRSKSGSLTRVGFLQRVQRWALYKSMNDKVRKVQTKASNRPTALDLPASARLFEFSKLRDLRIGTAIFIAAVLLICLIVHLSR
jgi:hypothetical protein